MDELHDGPIDDGTRWISIDPADSESDRCLVDIADYVFALRYRWHVIVDRRGKKKYFSRKTRSVSSTKQLRFFLHREVLARAVGPAPSPDHVGDHINGDSLDNRRCNLRWATKSENARNIHPDRRRKRKVK